MYKVQLFSQIRLSDIKRYIPSLNSKNPEFLLKKYESLNLSKFKNINDRSKQVFNIFSIPTITHEEDRNSMAFSIESQHPFLDHKLVNFCLNSTPENKFKKGWSKYILRKAVKGLPKAIKYRKDKQGYQNPEELYLKNHLQ